MNPLTDLPRMQVVPLEAEHCRELCQWQYPPPYDLFEWPDWDTMVRDGVEFGDPEVRERQYAAVVDPEGALLGFAQFFPLEGVTRLGLGLRPELCGLGRGIGLAFVLAIAEEARRRAPGNDIDLEVLTWNARAIRVYEKAGFRITDTYERRTPSGPSRFHCMVWSR